MISKFLIWLAVVSFSCAAEETEFEKYNQIPNQAMRPVVKSSAPGGTGGDPFDDTMNGTLLSKIIGIQSMTVTYTHLVESIQVTYLLSNKSLYEAPRHGGNTKTYPPIKVKLRSREYVKKVCGKIDEKFTYQISITTLYPKDRSVKSYTGPSGAEGGKNFTFDGYILGFFGRSGDLLDNIGVYQLPPLKKSESWPGSYYSKYFDENPDLIFFPPVVKINKLFINHGARVYAIQAEYLLLDGSIKRGTKYGEDQGNPLSVITFDRDEKIIGVKGTGYGMQVVCQMTFVTKKADGSTVYYGPYGYTWQTPFSYDGNMLGFYGGYATDLKSISSFGIYYV